MWTMSHNARATSNLYTSIAGGLLTSCGWVDTILYTLTRRRLLKDTMPESSTAGNSVNEAYFSKNTNQTRRVVVSGETMDFDLISPESTQRDTFVPRGPADRSDSCRSSPHGTKPLPSRLGSFRGRGVQGQTPATADHQRCAERYSLEALRLEVMLPQSLLPP